MIRDTRFTRADLESYPSIEKILEILNNYTENNFNATDLSFIDIDQYEEVIKEWLRNPDLNIKALYLGIEKGKEIISASGH